MDPKKNTESPENTTIARLSLRRERLRHLGIRSGIRTGDGGTCNPGASIVCQVQSCKQTKPIATHADPV